MAMSATAASALEQVKTGLAILYGANYFTEDEWIKINGLIRSKQYGCEKRPSHILDDDEPLIFFPDSQRASNITIQGPGGFPPNFFEKNAIFISEKEIQPPVCSETAIPTQLPAEVPTEPFTEVSPHDAANLVEPAQSAEQPSQTEHPETSSSNDINQAEKLPRDSTRDVVEAVRSEAELANEARESSSGLSSAENSEGETQSSDAANTSEREIWTHSPATEVDSDDIASPTQSDYWNQHHSNFPTTDGIRANDKFKVIDDSYNMSRFTRTTKSLADSLFAHDTSSGDDGPAPQLEVTPGTILIAQISFPKTTKVHVDISSGDSIKVMKKVSGIMYHGENLRTKHTGQFPSSIFQKMPRDRKKYPTIERSGITAAPKSVASAKNAGLNPSSVGNDLDKVEDLNAAEWDKDDVSVVTASLTANSSTKDGGMYPGLADLVGQSQFSDASQQQMILEMMSKMLDEKLQKIQNVGKKVAGSNRTSPCRSEARNPWTEPLKPVAPKSQICWFFATPNKECRFTAEECRDLHELYPPTSGNPLNLRMGKPTWGAAADLMTFSDDSNSDPKKREKTCWYWANASCEYTADTCRFLHKHVPAGVMPKPVDKKDYWKKGKKGPYSSAEGDDAANSVWGDGSPDLMDQEAVESAWLQPSPGKYKPPHVKALEEKEQMRSAGWW